MHLYKVFPGDTLQHDKAFCRSPTLSGMSIALLLLHKSASYVCFYIGFADFVGCSFMSFFAILNKKSVSLQDSETAVDHIEGKDNMLIRPTGSLADITNSTYNKHTHMTKKVSPNDPLR